jgi:hypothetical protein
MISVVGRQNINLDIVLWGKRCIFDALRILLKLTIHLSAKLFEILTTLTKSSLNWQLVHVEPFTRS